MLGFIAHMVKRIVTEAELSQKDHSLRCMKPKNNFIVIIENNNLLKDSLKK